MQPGRRAVSLLVVFLPYHVVTVSCNPFAHREELLVLEPIPELHHQQGTDSHFGHTTPEMVSVPKAHPRLGIGT